MKNIGFANVRKKDKNICNKPAKFFKNNLYYCKLHAKNSKFLVPTDNVIKIQKKIKKNKISVKALIEFANTHKIFNDLTTKEIKKKYQKNELISNITTFINDKYLGLY